MASQEKDGGPDGAFKVPEALPLAAARLPPTCGVAEAGGALEASIFGIDGVDGPLWMDFRLEGKQGLLDFADKAKAYGASLAAVAKGGKESRSQALALAKCGLSVKLVSLKKVGRALPSSIPLPDARWAAVLAWCLQFQAGRIDDGLRGRLVELAARFRKCWALYESATKSYLARASRSGADMRDIVSKDMGEIGKSVMDMKEKGLSDDEVFRRVPATATEDEGSALKAMDVAIYMATAPGEDEALAKMRDESNRWYDAYAEAHDQMLELLIERGQAGSLALLSQCAGIWKPKGLALLCELGSFFSDL